MTTIRPISSSEFRAYAVAAEAAFGADVSDEEIDLYRHVVELDRTLAVFDGERIVATAGAFSFHLRVPGGDVRAGGATGVGVAADQRRRGLLTSLMRHQLDDVAERGEPLAALWASEGGIYRRFGYGLATVGVSTDVDRRWSAFTPEAGAAEAAIRHVDVDEAQRLAPVVYDAARRERAGTYARPDSWWQAVTFGDPPARREQASSLRIVVAEDGDAPVGYATYALEAAMRDGLPDGTVHVRELVAASAPAAASLWRHLLDTDLYEHVVCPHRPVDDELPLFLLEPRRARRRLEDGLWVRIVDVAAALTARRYAHDDDIVLGVRDAFRPQAAGAWRVHVRDGCAEVEHTDARPDLELDIAELGSLYLGGQSATRLAAAGFLIERTAGAARRLDRMLWTAVAPWSPEVF